MKRTPSRKGPGPLLVVALRRLWVCTGVLMPFCAVQNVIQRGHNAASSIQDSETQTNLHVMLLADLAERIQELLDEQSSRKK